MKHKYIKKFMIHKLGVIAGLFRELRKLDEMLIKDTQQRMVGHYVLNLKIFKFHKKVEECQDLQIKDLDDLDLLKEEISELLLNRKINQSLLEANTHIEVNADELAKNNV
jgi:hypothetical protein